MAACALHYTLTPTAAKSCANRLPTASHREALTHSAEGDTAHKQLPAASPHNTQAPSTPTQALKGSEPPAPQATAACRCHHMTQNHLLQAPSKHSAAGSRCAHCPHSKGQCCLSRAYSSAYSKHRHTCSTAVPHRPSIAHTCQGYRPQAHTPHGEVNG
jgi:hypothetical protein